MTPFKIVYGRDPPTIVPVLEDNAAPPDILAQLQARDLLLLQLKKQLQKAQDRMKHFADKKRREMEFQPGEFVLVKLQPYRQHSLKLQRHQKLGLRYFGPFSVIEKIGSVAYRLLLPAEARIHPVFHVSLLKKYYGDHTTTYFPLPLLTASEGPILHPVRILATRQRAYADRVETQLLIDWGPAARSSWEPLSTIQQNYPTFDLGDKVNLYGEGNVIAEGSEYGSDGDIPCKENRVREYVPCRENDVGEEVQRRRSKRIRKSTWKIREREKD